jgi:hypothetical protein
MVGKFFNGIKVSYVTIHRFVIFVRFGLCLQPFSFGFIRCVFLSFLPSTFLSSNILALRTLVGYSSTVLLYMMIRQCRAKWFVNWRGIFPSVSEQELHVGIFRSDLFFHDLPSHL